MAEKICRECGASNNPESSTCSLCGDLLSENQDQVPVEKSSVKKTAVPAVSGGKSVILTVFAFVAAGFLLSFLAITRYDHQGSGSGRETSSAEEQVAKLPSRTQVWVDGQAEVALASGNPDLYFSLADTFFSYGQMEEGAHMLEKGYSLDSSRSETGLKIANAFYDSGNKKAAIRYYQRYLSRNPENLDARVDMATCYLDESVGAPMEAVKELKKVLEIKPDHQIANLNLGVLYSRINKPDQAESYLEKARSVNPENKPGLTAAELLGKLRQETK